ncbi:MAG: hydroxyethylthiazole kinase [Clostridia bacterium]|nr:hydroxyethylthiazole kinase [Clostridia bacterium]
MIDKVKKAVPLVHCITNPISINQCANAVLSLGARPIMAEHPDEAAQITETADALLLNIGNITDVRMKSIQNSVQTAYRNNIPFVLDAVGAACSRLRREFALDLIKKYPPAVLKGNYSEINALCNSDYKSKGVDSDSELTVEDVSRIAIILAKRYKTTVLASGKTDIITDGAKLFYVRNGTSQLSCVTGTGCMLGAICACLLPFGGASSSAVEACAILGICGELSETEKGSGTFLVNLIDNLSTVTDETINKMMISEEMSVEKI